MKLLQFAIASVVDANTGNGLPHITGGIDYNAAAREGRSIRAKSVIDVLGGIKQRVVDAFAAHRERREQKHGIAQLARLSDHSLEDIGFTRGDVFALQAGQIDLPQLEGRRYSEKGRAPAHLRNVPGTRGSRATGKAINAALFAEAKCA